MEVVSRLRAFGPLLLLLLSITLAVWSLGERASAAPSRPRLAVLLVFDQLRGDYLSRWESLFGEGGFRRLQQDGAWFTNCHYPYANTVTAAGHASLATGCSPCKHGMVGNEWYDRTAKETIYCATVDRYTRVPPDSGAEPSTGTKKVREGLAPERLLVPALGDALKEATGGKGRVVALSFKDRSAVLLGGHRPDACYWLDPRSGTFATSSYYGDHLHPWMAEFNHARVADRWFGQDWTQLRPELDYERYSGPDDVAAEGKGILQGRTFPHSMTGGVARPSRPYYEALYNSPYGNDLMLALVKRAVEAEQLGRHETPDLLCVSFSSNDPIGHSWGPDSQEVLDTTLRTDRLVKELLAFLDDQVGKDRYVLTLSADHGVCPLPEVARAQGHDAGRISPALLTSQAEEFMEKTYGKYPKQARWLEATPYPWVFLNQRLLRERGLAPDQVEERLARWLRKQPGILIAYSRTQLTQSAPLQDPIAESLRRCFHPDRCGDVAVVLRPYYLLGANLTGTTHGTPHAYDTHVPLLAYGPGIRGGARHEAVTPLAAPIILARVLGIPAPAAAEATVPVSLVSGEW